MKKVVISTGGGDAPGLNAVIYAVVHACYRLGWEVYGSKSGYAGFIDIDEMVRLTPHDVQEIYAIGGTILGSTNKGSPFARPIENLAGEVQLVDVSEKIMKNYRRMGFDCHIAIGGDGSLEIAHRFSKLGMNVIGVPKTIDNDLMATDRTFGFDTAVSTATEALDKLHSTAKSHDRVMVVEVMGRDAGHIALNAGIAGGANIIMIPEIPYKLDNICQHIQKRQARGQDYSIAVVSEAVCTESGEVLEQGHFADCRLGGIGQYLAEQITKLCGAETRVTVLGHTQRGGASSPLDRILASAFGVKAVELIAKEKYDHMVAWQNRQVISVPIAEAIKNYRAVNPQDTLVQTARGLGICLGD